MANEKIKLVINPIMETGDIKTAVSQIQGFFNKMNLSKGMKGDVEGVFRELINETERFEEKAKSSFKNASDVKALETSAKKIDTLFSKIIGTMDKLGGENLEKIFKIDDSKIQGLTQELAKLQQQLNSLTATSLDKVSNAIKSMGGVSKSSSLKGLFDDFQKGGLDSAGVKIENLIKNIQAFGGATEQTKTKVDTMLTAFQSGDISKFDAAFKELLSGLAKGSNIEVFAKGVNDLVQQFNLLASDGSAQQIRQNMSEINREISQVKDEHFRKLVTALDQARSSAAGTQQEIDRLGRSLIEAGQRTMTLGRQMDELKSRATYFLGLENSVDLFKRAIREAIEVVKELDKAMTDTAVVTDFSVGDMWETLPQYTKMANELGVATQGVYEASTLYYQQGLKTEQVMALTNETLKMARIAGLECADATDLMTAALRGFNMEINETNAQRVNDVYSELAAITAADTNEIATAMTKTASIASSANMELETTAALLAQMIETTREPAETAGTAMKTIVARFTEMKKAVGDIVTVEGEEINVNKVDAALASVGVQLKDTNNEFRNLDEVLLELASKWNSLDIMSQRYIATMAAGSRQQSRFIAMMQDYDRTMELVDAAYNSSGASQRQFNKTLESLDSKIDKLTNAWNEFLMGIANSTIIKTGIDLLTSLLNIINKLTTIPGDNAFSGIATSILKITAAVLAFQVALKGIDKAFASFETHRKIMKEMESIRVTGAFSNGVKASQADVDAARSGNKTHFKQKNNTEKQRFVRVNGDEASAAAEGAKSGAAFAGSAEAAAMNNPIGTEADLADATQEGAEYGTLWYRTADGVVYEKPIQSWADLANAYEQGAVWARMFVEGAVLELNGQNLGNFYQMYTDSPNALSTYVNPAGRDAQPGGGVKRIGDGNGQKPNRINVPFTEIPSKTDSIKNIFSTNKANTKESTAQFFKTLKTDGVKNAFEAVKTKATGAAAKITSGFGKVAGVLAGIPKPVYAVVAGIGAATAAVYLLWRASDEQVLKRTLEQATLSAENMAAAVEEIASKIDEVSESFSTLAGHRETLDSLVQGTLAWKEALLANNQVVLDLIKNHPELKEYLEVGDRGELTISKEGQEAYTNKLLNKQAGALSGQLNAEAYKAYYEGEKSIQEEFGRGQYETYEEDEDGNVNISTHSFEDRYNNGFTELPSDTDTGDFWVVNGEKQREKFQNFYNQKELNKDQFLKTLSATTLQGGASELQQKAVNEIAYDLMESSNIADLEGKYIQGLKIKRSKVAGEKLDVDEADEKTIQGLSDAQLAAAGFEWTDTTKTALRKMGSESETTFKVTEHGEVDTEKNLKDKLDDNEKNVKIDAGYIMAEIAKTEVPNNYKLLAGAITGSLSDEALKAISGEVLAGEDIDKAKTGLKAGYDNITKRLNKLKEGSDSEKNAELIKGLEDVQAYYEKTFEGIEDGNIDLATKVKTNKDAIIKDAEAHSVFFEKDEETGETKIDADTLNDYKKVMDGVSSLTQSGTNAVKAFHEAYGKFKEDADAQKGLTDFASSLNTNSAIKGFKQLKEGAKSSNAAIKSFSETLIESSENGGFYSGLSQLKELVSSEEFTDPENGLSLELSKLANEGELAASDILELAESGSLLDSALEAGALSAGTLAEVFQQMTTEGKDLTEFTQDYIGYLNELTASATASAEALQFVKDFSAPESQTTAQEGWIEWANELHDRAEAGAYNEQAFTALLKNFASEAQWEKWEQDEVSNEDRYSELEETINRSRQGAYSVLHDGITRQEEGNAVYLNNGKVTFNLSEFNSMEKLIARIAEQYEISEEYARQLISDARIYNTELDKSLKQMDKQNALLRDFRAYGSGSGTEDDPFTMTITNDFAKERGYKDGEAYRKAFEGAFKGSKVKVDDTAIMENNNIDTFKKLLQAEYAKSGTTGTQKAHYAIGAGRAAGLNDEQIKTAATEVFNGTYISSEVQEQFQTALITAQKAADAEQQANIAGQAAAVYDAYYDGVSQGMADALNGFQATITIILNGTEIGAGKMIINGATAGAKSSALGDKAAAAEENAAVARAAADAMNEKLEENTNVPKTTTTDTTIDPYTPYDPDGNSGGGGDKDKRNYAEENADKQLEALDRVRETNDREAELIGKLPEEIQFPLKMMNMAEDMAYEFQEIQINRNKLDVLEADQRIMNDEAMAKGLLGEVGSAAPIYYDEMLESYMWNVDAMNSLGDGQREKAHEMKDSLDELNGKIQEVKKELDGGKIQQAFLTAGKVADSFSEALKDTEKESKTLGDAFAKLGKGTILEKPLKALGDRFENLIDESKFLDKEFKGMGETLDKIPISDSLKKLVSSTLGEKAAGQLGNKGMGTALSGLFGKDGALAGMPGAETISQLMSGGPLQALFGAMTGDIGSLLGGMGSLLNFDMMGMGLDMFNGMKDMAQKMIQYVVQFITTVINWWINREDWLYNLLSAIEQEVHNFNRQEQVEERFRLYSDEGLNDLVSAWEAMRESLEKQIDLNEQLIKSRQAELQFLNLTNLPFSPAFYYDYTEERVIENPWVYDIYVLLLDLGAMIPEIGEIFSSIKQLMEDNKKRMEDAVKEIEDAREEILELEKKQLELRTKYMEDEIELEELVMDTIIEKQQEEIDELSAMNDAISEGNEKLIETLNRNLERIREQRDNEEKEEELGEKERRLAYLRQDTSNANRKEIMDLREELKDERRDYTDELIDQKISALEEQNERAAEQRQKQIDLLQAQLDHTEKYGLQWEEAQTLIKNGFDSEGRLRVGTDLFDMLMSKEDFTSMGLGSTRQVQQIMDWNVTSIAAAAFREINDIWDEGFGNFAMSNDVHDQSRLHLWADREVDYRQLPSWLSFLQPAYNTIQDYLWRTGTNIETFIDTSLFSGKNSSSILGKTVVPLIQGIAGNIESMAKDYNSLSIAETGDGQSHSGAIPGAFEGLNFGFGERIVKGITDGIVNTGENIVNGFKGAIQSNSISSQNRTQNNEALTVNQYFNSETDGETAAKSFIDAATGWFNGLNGKI